MPDIPEFYIDSLRVSANPFGITLIFGLSNPDAGVGQMQPAQDVVKVRMSLEHVKVMTMVLKRQIKAVEEQSMAPINIARDVLRQLGLSPEDW
jgi:hypothetical protein